ncbi:hypothetical protein C8R44DRAFT_746293 [Mycena epipterygia]|nr:hypothetical protein C8R44DRAFT_746293 [Mycena epipterygia]
MPPNSKRCGDCQSARGSGGNRSSAARVYLRDCRGGVRDSEDTAHLKQITVDHNGYEVQEGMLREAAWALLRSGCRPWNAPRTWIVVASPWEVPLTHQIHNHRQAFVDFGGIARRRGGKGGDGRTIETPLDGPLPTTIQSHNSIQELGQSIMPCGRVHAFNRQKFKFQCQKPRREPIIRPFPPSANFGNIVRQFHQWKRACALIQNAPLEAVTFTFTMSLWGRPHLQLVEYWRAKETNSQNQA